MNSRKIFLKLNLLEWCPKTRLILMQNGRAIENLKMFAFLRIFNIKYKDSFSKVEKNYDLCTLDMQSERN